jgi:hypothetical protein
LRLGEQVGDWKLSVHSSGFKADRSISAGVAAACKKLVNAFALRKGLSKSCSCRKLGLERTEGSAANDAISAKAHRALTLISQGLLSPADSLMAADGSPSCTLTSIALILGVNEDALIESIEV